MKINPDCKHYNLKKISRRVTSRITISDSEPVSIHECYHKDNLNAAGELTLTSKTCSIENDYCPYNPKCSS